MDSRDMLLTDSDSRKALRGILGEHYDLLEADSLRQALQLLE